MTKPKLSFPASMEERILNEDTIGIVVREVAVSVKEIVPRISYDELLKSPNGNLASFNSALYEGYEWVLVTFNRLLNRNG